MVIRQRLRAWLHIVVGIAALGASTLLIWAAMHPEAPLNAWISPVIVIGLAMLAIWRGIRELRAPTEA